MHQQISGVYEVIGRRLDRIVGDVAPTHLDVLCADAAEKPQIEISGNDLPGGAYSMGKPSRHRPCAGAHLEASPSFGDTDSVELAKRRWIVELLDQSQAREFVVRFVITPEVGVVRIVLVAQTSLPNTAVLGQVIGRISGCLSFQRAWRFEPSPAAAGPG